jgi:hypothetical protein
MYLVVRILFSLTAEEGDRLGKGVLQSGENLFTVSVSM